MAGTGGITRLPPGPSGSCRQHDETLEIDMLNKPLVIAIIATTLTSATLATRASAKATPRWARSWAQASARPSAIASITTTAHGWAARSAPSPAPPSRRTRAAITARRERVRVRTTTARPRRPTTPADDLLRAGAGLLRPSGRRLPAAPHLRGPVPELRAAVRYPAALLRLRDTRGSSRVRPAPCNTVTTAARPWQLARAHGGQPRRTAATAGDRGRSVPRVPRRSRERDHVAHVGEPVT